MKKISLVLFIVFLCCGCGNSNKNNMKSSEISVKEKNTVGQISSTIKLQDINKLTDKDRIVQNSNHIFVYDITNYNEENIVYQYQYFIYNAAGTKILDTGIQGGEGYIFEKISDAIVRGKKSLGSNVWECIYYNQKTERKSQKFETPIIEISNYVGYLVDKDGVTYLKIEDMFDDKKSYSYKLGKEEYIPGILSATYKDGVINILNQGGGKPISIEVGDDIS